MIDTTLARQNDFCGNSLDPGSKMLAAQDFRCALQQREEAVADYIRRLERAFRQAYGADGMSSETRDALLFGQK